MRFFSPSSIVGSLGTLVQRTVAGLNALVISNVDGNFADDAVSGGQTYNARVSIAAGAAVFSHTILFNPNGSTVFAYVDAITITNENTAAMDVDVKVLAATLGNNQGTYANKLLGSGVGTCTIRSLNNSPAPAGAFLNSISMAPGTTITLRYEPPIKMPANTGIVVVNGTVNVAGTATFQFREKST